MPDDIPQGSTPRATDPVGARDDLARRLSWVAVVATVLVAYRSSFGFDLVGDAVFLIGENSQMRSWSFLPHQLWSDYFASDAGTTIGYWRPLTKASWLVETMLGGGRTWVYHAANLAWLALAALGVQALATALGAGTVLAATAGAVFAVHPALYEPASLVMARSDLACAAASTWALAGWVRWRRGETTQGWVHGVALVAAFASKETAVALVPTLAVWALLDGGLRSDRRRALVSLLPVVGVTMVYASLRGAVVAADGVGVAVDPVRILAGAAMYCRALWPFTFEAGVRNLGVDEAGSAPWVLLGVVAITGVLAVGVLAARRRWAAGVGLVVWASSSLAPVLLVPHLNTPGESGAAYAFSDRWAAQAVAAFVVLGAVGLARLGRRAERISAVAGALWVAAAAAAGPVVHAAYADPVALLSIEDRDFDATPERFRTPFLRCRHAERSQLRFVASGRLDDALASIAASRQTLGCDPSLEIEASLLAGLVRDGRWDEARALVDGMHLPRGWRDQHRVALMMGTVLARTGAPERALPMLALAREGLPGECAAPLTEGQALASLERWSDATRSFEDGFECQLDNGTADPAVLVAAADTASRAGMDAEAVRLLDRAGALTEPLASRAAAIRGRISERSPSP